MSTETISFTLAVLAAGALSAWGLFTWLDRRDKKGHDVGLSFWIDDPTPTHTEHCPGPLIWYEASEGAILLCAHCGYLVTTGGFMDEAHAETSVLREGLAW